MRIFIVLAIVVSDELQTGRESPHCLSWWVSCFSIDDLSGSWLQASSMIYVICTK
jgi:hypothetical protein